MFGGIGCKGVNFSSLAGLGNVNFTGRVSAAWNWNWLQSWAWILWLSAFAVRDLGYELLRAACKLFGLGTVAAILLSWPREAG